MWGWFVDVRGDELGDCGDLAFFFWVMRDDDVGIWGVSSSFASEFELRVWDFVFVRFSVKRSPLAPVLGSFFVKYAESVACWCGSFDYKFVLLQIGAPPLQIFEIKVDGNQDQGVVWVCSVVSSSEGSVFVPICLLEISFGDVTFSPMFDVV